MIRQIRVKKDTCVNRKDIEGTILNTGSDCHAEYSTANEMQDDIQLMTSENKPLG